jgi:hypothetical protein
MSGRSHDKGNRAKFLRPLREGLSEPHAIDDPPTLLDLAKWLADDMCATVGRLHGRVAIAEFPNGQRKILYPDHCTTDEQTDALVDLLEANELAGIATLKPVTACTGGYYEDPSPNAPQDGVLLIIAQSDMEATTLIGIPDHGQLLKWGHTTPMEVH